MCDIMVYYIASSVTGQDESNLALWLASRAGKMQLSCRLMTTHRFPHEKIPQMPYNKSFIDQACLVMVAGYILASFCFCVFIDRDGVQAHINFQKQREGSIFKTSVTVFHWTDQPAGQ